MKDWKERERGTETRALMRGSEMRDSEVERDNAADIEESKVSRS